jgi:N-acyl-D-amino-acid deacylase
MAGRMLEDVATEWGMTARQAAEELLPAGAIFFQMDEVDVRRIMVHELSMIGSDGLPHDSYPYPRLWGRSRGWTITLANWDCSAWNRQCGK